MDKDAIVSCLCWALHPSNDLRHKTLHTLTRARESKFASLSMSDQEDHETNEKEQKGHSIVRKLYFSPGT